MDKGIDIGVLVHVKSLNSLGYVIDKGTDPNGNRWYRTDVDGIRDECDLQVVRNLEDLLLTRPFISDSTLERIMG